MAREKYSTVDEYHASFPKEIRERLDVVRKLVHDVAPDLHEMISYNIPGYRKNKMVVYYAGFKNHISIFPAPRGKEWEEDFKPYYTSGKGTIQFPHEKRLPLTLIKKIVKYRVAEDAKQINRPRSKKTIAK
jgi:uncharacterized protein YdhG (YjbR/CyaY superfamily)